jgi:hypothetical protein
MPETSDVADVRARYEAKTAALVGRGVLDVAYWDIHNHSAEPRTWDYNDWHHAVMGVELATDGGPVSVVCTDTFFPFGVEVFQEPISEHLLLGPEGPEGWTVGRHPFWQARSGSPVRTTDTFWEEIEVGPGIRQGDGARVSEPKTYQVPVALRLDFDAGPIWMVAGIPQWPDVDRIFVPGDEVLVVFSPDRMRKIGFPASDFLGQQAR